MWRKHLGLQVVAFSSVIASAISHEAMAKQNEAAMKTYSSPREVFDAFREAYRKKDWHILFLLYTPERQRDLVFETLFACEDAGGQKFEKLKSVKTKFGITEASLEREYLEQYKRNHGHGDVIDKYLAKAIPYSAQSQSKKNRTGTTKTARAPSPPTPDEEAAVRALPTDERLAAGWSTMSLRTELAFSQKCRTFLITRSTRRSLVIWSRWSSMETRPPAGLRRNSSLMTGRRRRQRARRSTFAA